jgi:hypothetical protein
VIEETAMRMILWALLVVVVLILFYVVTYNNLH